MSKSDWPICEDEPITTRISDAVRITGLSRTGLYRLAAQGNVLFRKAGRTVLVDVVSLQDYIASLPVAKIKHNP